MDSVRAFTALELKGTLAALSGAGPRTRRWDRSLKLARLPVDASAEVVLFAGVRGLARMGQTDTRWRRAARAYFLRNAGDAVDGAVADACYALVHYNGTKALVECFSGADQAAAFAGLTGTVEMCAAARGVPFATLIAAVDVEGDGLPVLACLELANDLALRSILVASMDDGDRFDVYSPSKRYAGVIRNRCAFAALPERLRAAVLSAGLAGDPRGVLGPPRSNVSWMGNWEEDDVGPAVGLHRAYADLLRPNRDDADGALEEPPLRGFADLVRTMRDSAERGDVAAAYEARALVAACAHAGGLSPRGGADAEARFPYRWRFPRSLEAADGAEAPAAGAAARRPRRRLASLVLAQCLGPIGVFLGLYVAFLAEGHLRAAVDASLPAP